MRAMAMAMARFDGKLSNTDGGGLRVGEGIFDGALPACWKERIVELMGLAAIGNNRGLSARIDAEPCGLTAALGHRRQEDNGSRGARSTLPVELKLNS
jgi:hypothetical protein